MATSTSHPPFPSRPYTSALGRTGNQGAFGNTPYNPQQTSYAAPAPAANQTSYAAPAPAANAGGYGGVTQQQKEAQRLERERHERAERERREAEERGVLEALSEEQREEVNEAFQLFDLDKDNHIDYHELKVALKALGFDLPKTDIIALLSAHGVPASTMNAHANQQTSKQPVTQTFSGPSRLLLSHASFLQIAAKRIVERDPREEINRAFDLFDQEGKGRIEIGDLRRVARELGEGLQEEELEAMIEEFDVRGEGGISRDEFMGICLGG